MRAGVGRYHGILRGYFNRLDRPLDEDFDGFAAGEASLLGFSRASSACSGAKVLVTSGDATVVGLPLEREGGDVSGSSGAGGGAALNTPVGTVVAQFTDVAAAVSGHGGAGAGAGTGAGTGSGAKSVGGHSVWIDLGRPCLVRGVNLAATAAVTADTKDTTQRTRARVTVSVSGSMLPPTFSQTAGSVVPLSLTWMEHGDGEVSVSGATATSVGYVSSTPVMTSALMTGPGLFKWQILVQPGSRCRAVRCACAHVCAR